MSQPHTSLFLVRHGHTDAIGRRLVGRLPGIPLSELGRAQTGRLPGRLRRHTAALAAIYASPLQRAMETAEPLARAYNLPVRPCEGILEVDFGAWTGRTFEELEGDPDWQRFNTQRSLAAVPGGERAIHVQARMVAALEALAAAHAGAAIAVISHADVIRAAILHYVGAPLDAFDRIEIGPASITGVRVGWNGPTVLVLNEQD